MIGNNNLYKRLENTLKRLNLSYASCREIERITSVRILDSNDNNFSQCIDKLEKFNKNTPKIKEDKIYYSNEVNYLIMLCTLNRHIRLSKIKSNV